MTGVHSYKCKSHVNFLLSFVFKGQRPGLGAVYTGKSSQGVTCAYRLPRRIWCAQATPPGSQKVEAG